MSKIEIVGINKHADININTGYSESFDDVSNICAALAGELPHLVLEYPVFITKNPTTGEFELTVLLGLEEKENLFIQGEGWNAGYIPLDIRRQPFQACFMDEEGMSSESNVKVGINIQSNRIIKEGGESLFNDAGEPSGYLSMISDILGALVSGFKATKVFLVELAKMDLIESVGFNIQLAKDKNISLNGLYTINADKLKQLSANHVVELHQKGYLQACYAIIHSRGHAEKLVNEKKRRVLETM